MYTERKLGVREEGQSYVFTFEYTEYGTLLILRNIQSISVRCTNIE